MSDLSAEHFARIRVAADIAEREHPESKVARDLGLLCDRIAELEQENERLRDKLKMAQALKDKHHAQDRLSTERVHELEQEKFRLDALKCGKQEFKGLLEVGEKLIELERQLAEARELLDRWRWYEAPLADTLVWLAANPLDDTRTTAPKSGADTHNAKELERDNADTT